MIALGLCILALVATYWAGRRSLGQGLVVLLAFGYFYGILRANLLVVYSHFIFDAGLIGLFLSQFVHSSKETDRKDTAALRWWTAILVIWPILMVFMPFQPWLVSLAGLRGGAFFLPVLLLGSRLKEKDLLELSYGLAALNIIAAGFAILEYLGGVARFYPFSPVTLIIYASGDVAGGFFRIPAIFPNAHSYGGTMVYSLPFLIGLWDHDRLRLSRPMALLGIGCALLGILLSAARQHFIMGSLMILVTFMTKGAKKGSPRLLLIVLIAALGWVAATHERLQRFTSLSNTDYVSDRIAGSVNRGFWEILEQYPMGNGLGGGGTSIPYFLEGQVRNPIGMENGFALILCEQGVIGLMFWLLFIAWFFTRVRTAFKKAPWSSARRMAWCVAAASLATAWIGLGMFNSIPGTLLLFISMSWTAVPQAVEPCRVTDARLTRLQAYRPARALSIR